MLYRLVDEGGHEIIAGEATSRYSAIQDLCTFLLMAIPPRTHVVLSRSPEGFDVWQVHTSVSRKRNVSTKFRKLYSAKLIAA